MHGLSFDGDLVYLGDIFEMENKKSNVQEYEVDILHILKAIWKKMWVIVLCAIVVAAIGFSYAAFFVTPMYSSSAMMYVNNKSISLGGTSVSISSSEIIAAQSLVKTYLVILNNRTTLEQVIEKTGVDCTVSQLSRMITAGAVNETEIFRVTVTCDDPYMAAKIVNGIAEVLPERVSDIIQGSSMKIVDRGVVNLRKVSPNVTSYTMIGFLLGAAIASLAVIIHTILDDTIHGEEYISQKYEYPILARIPDLSGGDSSKYKYYKYKSYKYSYGYGDTRQHGKDGR